ncbi:kelch-like protein 18 [Phymastichus coffea]|uniref:kelch-like protein 18 n=1 Tax=Phymastichus coffea TaxID=108790 RepID=UPI00273C5CCA|nr:kelch-like protein 18 [Phymastichus coffea]XP_058803936.1 kelch-like protein 18 [Phymastichus coffea]XP_058803937.1 kelch-like protein 18 [Phymastichus coffea]XP_058803938.1 kelch-like protein 18 [Phymastichus coffea]
MENLPRFGDLQNRRSSLFSGVYQRHSCVTRSGAASASAPAVFAAARSNSAPEVVRADGHRSIAVAASSSCSRRRPKMESTVAAKAGPLQQQEQRFRADKSIAYKALGEAPLSSEVPAHSVAGLGLTDKQIVYQNPEHCANSFPTFEHIRRQGKLCDVTLKVDDESFSAHRLVLAATIPYFNGMFLNDMAESKQKTITLQGFDSTALEAFINYAYSGRIILTNDNVQSIMIGASFLGLLQVKNACADFLKSRFHPHNVLGIRNFADMLSCTPLLDQSNKYIHRYFEDVSQSEEFLGLPFDELRDLVSNDDLNISSEKEVFEAVIRWLKHDAEARKDKLPELLALVRLPLLSPEYLVDCVAKEELVRSSHQCRDLLDEAKDYHLIPNRRYLIDNIRIRPRCNFVMGHIFAVGGLTKFGDSLSTVEVFDPFTGTWQKSEAMTTLRSRVGVAVHKNKLYAFGGYNGSERLSTVEVYDPYKKIWKIIAPMHCKRSAVGTAALNDYIYVCGGYDGVTSLKTVERYCPDSDKWRMVCSMNKHRSAGGVVAFQGYIYALGGHDGLSIYDSVERYDPRTDTWMVVKPMLTRRCRLGVATLNGKLYVCGGYDGSTFLQSVEVYDAKTDTWSYVASMNVMRSRAALVANMGKLWAIGGYDGISNLSTVEVYDPETNIWIFAPSMYAHEGGVGVGVITL